MIEKNETYSLDFTNIMYDVIDSDKTSSQKYKRLINNISGRFVSGQLTIVMGPSGSCKTSLMKLLIGSPASGSRTSGLVTFKGKERSAKKWMREYAFLEQDDCIYPKQSVYEYIYFAVKCRRKNSAEKEVVESIRYAMEHLQITKIWNTCIENVSGGERKRVMIAVEICMKPEILILDEPTSGLDANIALELTHLLKEYAMKENKIVVMTIHQPGSGLFDMCHHLYFLYNKTVFYDGPIASIDGYLASNKIHPVGKLSTPELMFQMFTDHSIYPEVREYKPIVEQIVKVKNEQANLLPQSQKFGSSSDSVVDLSVNFTHVAMLISRELKTMMRYPVGFILWLFVKLALSFGFLFLAIKLELGGMIEREVAFALKTLEGEKPSVLKLIPIFAEIFGSSLGRRFLVAGAAGGLFMFCLPICFSNLSILDRSRPSTIRELSKGTYSIMSLYVAGYLGEMLYTTIYTVPYFIAASVVGLWRGMLSPIFAASVFILLFLIKPIFIFISSLNIFIGVMRGAIATLQAMGYLFSFMFSSPNFIFVDSAVKFYVMMDVTNLEGVKEANQEINRDDPGTFFKVIKYIIKTAYLGSNSYWFASILVLFYKESIVDCFIKSYVFANSPLIKYVLERMDPTESATINPWSILKCFQWWSSRNTDAFDCNINSADLKGDVIKMTGTVFREYYSKLGEFVGSFKEFLGKPSDFDNIADMVVQFSEETRTSIENMSDEEIAGKYLNEFQNMDNDNIFKCIKDRIVMHQKIFINSDKPHGIWVEILMSTGIFVLSIALTLFIYQFKYMPRMRMKLA